MISAPPAPLNLPSPARGNSTNPQRYFSYDFLGLFWGILEQRHQQGDVAKDPGEFPGLHKSSPICSGSEHGSNCKGFGKPGAECDNRSSLRAQSKPSGDISAPGERNAGITAASPPQDWWWRQRAGCSGISPTQKQPATPHHRQGGSAAAPGAF